VGEFPADEDASAIRHPDGGLDGSVPGIGVRPQVQRGARTAAFVPADPFDPAIFNRRFFGPQPPRDGQSHR
jgi:hypothetical protein